MPDEPLVLGIETSCDETGVGIVRGSTLLADAVASSVEEHVRFGGVVPEVASRAHLEALVPTVERACDTAGVALRDLDAVASVAGDVTELQRIAVDPAHRRTGVASALLEEVTTLARSSRCDRVLLEVREDNTDALAFYADRGFVEVARRRRYYRDGATAVVLRRSLVRGCGSTSTIDP